MNELPIFVYGTLKQGECRAPLWPHPPLRVVPAWTFGQLHDLGPYPALVAGRDRVAGELWFLAPEHQTETLRVLDEVEGFSQLGDDEYRRERVECRFADGGSHAAQAYFFAQPEQIADQPIVRAGSDGLVAWRGAGLGIARRGSSRPQDAS